LRCSLPDLAILWLVLSALKLLSLEHLQNYFVVRDALCICRKTSEVITYKKDRKKCNCHVAQQKLNESFCISVIL